MLEAGEYTMQRFAGLYGMTYGGMVTNRKEAEKLAKTIEGGIFDGIRNAP